MSNHQHSDYRPDIDGLRALAVVLVIGYHAFPKTVTGGFVGVDVFFVISGFLISRIILAGLFAGTFRFSDFFARRIVRIFPALLAVLITCYLLGWPLLFGDEYQALGKHIAAGAGFGSNILLWLESGYFDSDAELKPLLHLWSLGIEEQFYLIWPLVLFWGWKRCRLFLTVLVCCVGSFLLNLYLTGESPSAAFYWPITRFWELLLGSLLAIVTLQKGISRRPTGWFARCTAIWSKPDRAQMRVNLCHAFSLAGLLLIVMAVVFTDKYSPFPGWIALLPTLGALLLIAAGQNAVVNKTILSRRVFVLCGLISYSLYLWHWPLLSFAYILEAQLPTVELRLAAVVASVILAILTYRWIEKPFRQTKRVARPRRIVMVCSLMTLIGLIGWITYRWEGLPWRLTADVNEKRVRQWRMDISGTDDCLAEFTSIESGFCRRTAMPRVAIIGDSHAGHLFYGFATHRDPRFRNVIVMGAGSCQPTIGVEVRKGCDSQLRSALSFIEKTPSIEVVILSSFYDFLDHRDASKNAGFFAGYEKTFVDLEKLKKRVLFVQDIPTLSFNPDTCINIRSYSRKQPRRVECWISIASLANQRHTYNHFVAQLRERFTSVEFYDPAELLTKEGKVHAMLDGTLQYSDYNHLSIYGSQRVADGIIQYLHAAPPAAKSPPKRR